MTDFHVEAFRIDSMEKHPNADLLSIVKVHGIPVIVKPADFKQGDWAIYIPVDAVVPTDRPEFSFLAYAPVAMPVRIQARRLRGIYSEGLVIPCPPGMENLNGDQLCSALGITKWVPEAEREPKAPVVAARSPKRIHNALRKRANYALYGIAASSAVAAYLGVAALPLALVVALAAVAAHDGVKWVTKINTPPKLAVYDIENVRRHPNTFEQGEVVQITEKIHGCNARFHHNGHRFFAGSRTMWRARPKSGALDVWNKAADDYKLAEKLKNHPNYVLFGEVFGSTQDLNYGVPKGENRFQAFDVYDLKTGEFLTPMKFVWFCFANRIPTVPEIYFGPWHTDVLKHAEGKTTLGDKSHVREGIVVKSVYRGRKILKLAGEGYQLRKVK